jgi:hypothetical protein
VTKAKPKSPPAEPQAEAAPPTRSEAADGRSPNEVEPSPVPGWFDQKAHLRLADGRIMEHATGRFLNGDGDPASPAVRKHEPVRERIAGDDAAAAPDPPKKD